MNRYFVLLGIMMLSVFSLCLFSTTQMNAQISIGGKPYSFLNKINDQAIPVVAVSGLEKAKIEAEDAVDEANGLPPRFGYPHEVNLNLENSGRWETLPNGDRVWRLGIYAPNALSINLLYNDFFLPDESVLYIYSADRKHLIGGFTSANNKPDRIFATGLVYGDNIVLEYYLPLHDGKGRIIEEKPAISINYVVHGYRYIQFDPKDLEKAFGGSGSCNVNTICAEGDNWRDQIKSVAMLLSGGSRFCTGYLVNNTAQDCRPLLLTANHCLGSADAISSPNVNTWTFMWRYESPNCTPNTDGPTTMTTSGGTVLANPGSPGTIFSSDFALIEMAENPKTAGYDVYFAGFDATTTAPGSATGIHHPSGDVKKISMETAALTGTAYGSASGTATHWRVADWDSGTTEPGSSGSPIFSDATKRAMGFLSGGGAACGNNLSDWYGSLGYSWTNGGASDSRRRLRDHLDPGNVATFVDGSANPCGVTPPVGCTGTTYASAANLNIAIPDNTPAGVSAVITVAASGNVTELKCVTVTMSHTWTGDLVATFTHVSSGTSVQLFRRLNASNATNIGESSNMSGTYTFCATGASFAAAANNGGTDFIIPPGTYAQSSVSLQATPAQNTNTFANFVGLSLNGDWRLTVSDYSSVDIGTISSWSFEACSGAASCPTFSGAPANVTIVNSTCNSGTVSGGSITAPGGTPCPAGSVLQYMVDNGSWSTTLPNYNQTGQAQTIKTRCSCESDPLINSAESNPVTTIPGTCVPANDLCANAAPISCGTTISSTNVNATAEPGTFSPCGVVQTTAGVWYTFTGDGSTVTLSTCSAANFDTKISVYTGGCTTPTCVTGNDDACSGGRSSVTFTTANGTVYLILIHGFGGATGTFDLSMTCVSACPTFSGAPANVSIVNSSCGSGCTLTGGSFTAPAGMPCPTGSTLQYNVNNSGWTTTLPDYNQAGPAQTIRTRCSCNSNANTVSAESDPVTTIPGTLANPVVPANGFNIVACPALATQPTPPVVTACDGSVITPGGPSIINTPNPLTCEGTRTYTWTYSCGSTSSTWSYTYTIERQSFTVPANGAATVNSPTQATQPTPPMVSSNCGEQLTPVGPTVTNNPDPVTCTGMRTYSWTYTDCEGNSATWSFVYTIIDNTPPTVTAGSIAACYPTVAAAQAAALAATSATDNCPGVLTETATTTGTCSAVITVTTTDANSNPTSVTYNTRIDNTPPTLVCRTATVFLGGNGSYTLTQADVFNAASSSDNCPGALTVTNISPATVNCGQLNQTIPVTVTVQDGCGNVATCTAQITVQAGTALPAGWNTGNTGSGSGSAGYNPCAPGGQFTVASTGFTPTLTGEAVQEAYQNICGNTTITVRVAGITGGGWAGITLRESLALGSKMVALKTQLTNSVRREHRSVTNGLKTTQTLPLPQIAEWLRIQRTGNIFTFSVSPNGINWSPAGTVTLALSNCLLVGLFAESINVNTTTTAVFNNVTIIGGVAPLAGDTSNGWDQTAAQQPEFSVYPNPTTGAVTVDLSAYASRETVRLQVFNTNGQPIHNLELNNLETTTQRLDLSTLPNGVYLIRVQSDGLPDAVNRVVLHSGVSGK